MVITVLYNPLVLASGPNAFRMSLLWRASRDDHECENDIEQQGDRVIWKSEISCTEIELENSDGPRILADERNTHGCASYISQISFSACGGLEYIPNEARYIKNGNEIAQ